MRLRRRGAFAWLSLGLFFLVSCAQTKAPMVSVPSSSDANDPCYMCHMPFTGEEVSVAHLRAGISCSDCHGKSLAHTADETFSTAPDILYSRNEVNSFCRTCHPTHPNIPPEKLVGLWIERNRRPLAPREGGKEIICTDCHGSHRIARRQR